MGKKKSKKTKVIALSLDQHPFDPTRFDDLLENFSPHQKERILQKLLNHRPEIDDVKVLKSIVRGKTNPQATELLERNLQLDPSDASALVGLLLPPPPPSSQVVKAVANIFSYFHFAPSVKNRDFYQQVYEIAGLSPTPTDRTKHYRAIGSSLVAGEIAQNLIKEICDARIAASQNHHFYLVDGPSGIGKTQLPFIFREAKVPLHHLLMTIDNSQDVYQPLKQLSSKLANALKNDLQHRRCESNGLEMQQLMDNQNQLETVGVIFALLNAPFDDTGNWTVGDLANYVQKCQDKSSLPIFFLDEVLPHHDENNQIAPEVSSQLRLARNLLRAVGLVAVLMGTNSCAANFVTASLSSRRDDSVWCKLITQLPQTTDDSLNVIGVAELINRLQISTNLGSICQFLTEQFRSCIPWFIELFVQVVKENEAFLAPTMTAVDFIDNVFCKMANRIYRRKNIRSHQSSLRAQFCYHLEPYRNTKQIGNKVFSEGAHPTSNFVCSHFAALNDADCSLCCYANSLRKVDEESTWAATASFPRANEDCLFYLMFGGGKKSLEFPLPFLTVKSLPMTSLETFLHLMKDHKAKSAKTDIDVTNSNAVKRNGDHLEAVAGVAVEVASHRGGVGGIILRDFLLELATQLLPSHQHLTWTETPLSATIPTDQTNTNNLTNALNAKKVPYLTAPGDSWPETFKEIEGVCWGNLSRTREKERIDMKILTAENPNDPDISFECKNYENKIDLSVLREILIRIPDSSTLHIIIGTYFQDKYFTKGTEWDEFKADKDLHETAILKVVLLGSQLTLEPLFPNSVPGEISKFVIMFPIEDWPVEKAVERKVEESNSWGSKMKESCTIS